MWWLYFSIFSCQRADKTVSQELDGLDIQNVDLSFNIETLNASATINLQTSQDSIVLSAKEIIIQKVFQNSVEVDFLQENAVLTLENSSHSLQELEIHYTFPERSLWQFDGWMPNQGISFIWPDYCGNLYPCNPNTQDGIIFTMDVSGVPEGQMAIFTPDSIGQAPPYMPAIAMGEYTHLHVGTSDSGIDVSAWYLDGVAGLEEAEYGVWNMVESLNFMEEVYGPYLYGKHIGTVEVDWGADSYGGMEHHPFFHVGKYDFWNEEAQIHELAHGWFGDAVRLECWEDFVLSEGTVTYMTAKTLQEVAGYDLWEYYVSEFLIPICEGEDYNALVMPDGCNDIDFENDNLWSLATYMKGACFYEEVGDIIGEEVIDQVISEFYFAHKGQSATMEDMLALLDSYATPDQKIQIAQSIQDWLRQEACPTDYANRCLYRD